MKRSPKSFRSLTSSTSMHVQHGTERNAADCANAANWHQPLLLRQWKYLWPKESVQLQRGSEVIATGWIDDIAPGATVLWVQLSEGRGRKMIQQGDGIDIYRLDFQIHELPLKG